MKKEQLEQLQETDSGLPTEFELTSVLRAMLFHFQTPPSVRARICTVLLEKVYGWGLLEADTKVDRLIELLSGSSPSSD